MNDTLQGTFDHAIFSNDENGFTVGRLIPFDKEEKVTVVGYLGDVDAGESITCLGSWKKHPAHGEQFEITSYKIDPPHNLIGIERYLESGSIRGIGKKYAKRIVERFGLQTLTIIDEKPERLLEIEGIGAKRISRIKECWSDKKHIRNVMVFLRSHGVGSALAQKIYKKYGDESIDKIKKNPYLVASDMNGVGFKTVDKIAKSMGIKDDAEQRVKSGIEYTLSLMTDEGHVCMPQDKLVETAQEILHVEHKPIEAALEKLISETKLIRKEIKEGQSPFIWLRPYFMSEIGICRELDRINSSVIAMRRIDCPKAIAWVEENEEIEFADLQKTAIERSSEEKIHIITGGPGTGKSTITKAILDITEKITDKILLAAPTGRAAKRMSEITKKRAQTIHSLLEFDFITGRFKRNKDNPLECELIIIDEASMIDTFLMFNLLKAIPTQTRVIFIGDIDQLPSVGAGNVLKDLIDSEKITTTRLTEIYRQGKYSRIIYNAHRINEGEFPDVKPKKKSDFHFLDVQNPEDILETIVDLNARRLPNHYKLDPLKEIQVLSPMKRGLIGTENLNLRLQAKLNSNTEKLSVYGKTFLLGDKVMQMKNNYTKKVSNGDVGFLTEIDHDLEMVIIEYYGRAVEYDFTELDQVVLAYAVSIHKYQGSECKCIVMPIHTSHFKLLYRNLLYTGITRGKRQVVLVGTKKAIAIAVKNDEVKKRYTTLKEMLQGSI